MINRILSLFNLRLVATKRVPKDYIKKYNNNYIKCKNNNRNFKVYKNFHYDLGHHPESFIDFQCTFASRMLNKLKPDSILDVGSYRYYILGLLAMHKVTTIDIRQRKANLENETTVTCDAKQLRFDDNSFDLVLSLCALEHFGLSRYGDDFDLDADIQAFNEMIRVLKPGGFMLFSTTVTRSCPAIAFNAHRIYDYSFIVDLCDGLKLYEELFFSQQGNKPCSFEQLTDEENKWDVYCGCWEKPDS